MAPPAPFVAAPVAMPRGEIVAPPVAAPVAPAVPVANPVTPTASPELTFDSTPAVVAPRNRRKKGAWKRIVVPLIVFLLIGGMAGAGVWMLYQHVQGDWEEQDNAKANKAFGNFGFTKPRGWTSDPDLRTRMRVNLAMTRRNPRGNFALAYKDYKTRVPSDGEILQEALTWLRGIFPQLEYEDPLQTANKGRRGELDGEPAISFPFVGVDHNEVPMRGECWMLTRHGYGYWLFFWGPETDNDALQPRFERARERFKLLDEREGWKPRPRESETVPLGTLPLQFSYPKDVWRQEQNPADADEKALVVLRGFEPTETPDGKKRIVEYAGKAATVQVLVLPKAENLEAGYKAAQDHIQKRLADLHTAAKFDPIKDRKTEKPIITPEVGALRGQVSRLNLTLGADNERYAILAVVNREEGLLAIFCECKGDRRTYWDGEFMAVLETVRPRNSR